VFGGRVGNLIIPAQEQSRMRAGSCAFLKLNLMAPIQLPSIYRSNQSDGDDVSSNGSYQPRPPTALRGILWARHTAYSAMPPLIAKASSAAFGQPPYVTALIFCLSLGLWLLSNIGKFLKN
jgi:hypothetical protein